MNKEQQREIAIKRLEQLDIYKPYINAFKKQGTVTMFERYVGYYATADNNQAKIESIIKDFEKEYGGMVYAVTHERTEFGELYDLLYVSNDKNDEPENLYKEGDVFFPYAYVYNADDDISSEFGEIGVNSLFGGIGRCY